MSLLRRFVRSIAALPRPLWLVLAIATLLHAVPIDWGLPSSDKWDVDGIAPRHFLPGLADSFSPGRYDTYPPLHQALLAVLTLPITLIAVARAQSTSLPAIIQEIIAPPYMTAMALIARIVSVVMSIGIVIALGKVAEEPAPENERRASLIGAALVVALDAPLTYYAHVTNLDVPYLFWASLALLAFVRAIARREPRRLRGAALLAACAIATKDQAYAMFILGAPAALALWYATDAWARENVRAVAKDAAIGAAYAIGFLLIVDGVLVNPTGFRARLAFLSGPASQDYATYSRDLAGWTSIVLDTFREIDAHYPRAVFALAAVGLVVAVRRANVRAAALVPALFAVSFTIFFNLAARRVEERFTLPQMLVLGLYAGCGVAWLWRCVPGEQPARRAFAWMLRIACVVVLARAAGATLRIDATMLREPRYDAEAWLEEHARESDIVEVHGLNDYLARPTRNARTSRVGPGPADRRNPMWGVEEVQARLSEIEGRRPRFVVVNECYAWRYLPREPPAGGRTAPSTLLRDANDEDATTLFQGLFAGRFAYHLAHESRIRSTVFPRYELHASLGCPVWIFERNDAP